MKRQNELPYVLLYDQGLYFILRNFILKLSQEGDRDIFQDTQMIFLEHIKNRASAYFDSKSCHQL